MKNKTDNPLVSIVTVTYNAQSLLTHTMENILNQDYENIEYIIIDGASTDGTTEIIKKYANKISYWISESDNGIYDAMNKGIDAASGEWINFMNAGDSFCSEETVSSVIKNLEATTDLISGDIYYIKENQESVYKKQQDINYPMQNMFCYHQTLFTKLSLHKKIKFSTEFKIAGDYNFVLECYMKNYKFQYLDMPIANFLEGGMAESTPIRARIEDMFIQSKYLENYLDIFNSHSYARFNGYTKTNNSSLSRLLNNLYTQCDEYKLSQKQFVLYGYGNIGEIIANKYPDNIIAIVDRNYKTLNHPQIQSLEQLHKQEFDYILISVLGKEKEIKQLIQSNYHIQEEKILTFNI